VIGRTIALGPIFLGFSAAVRRALHCNGLTFARIDWGDAMAEARRMGKSELFSHFADRFEVKRTQAREYFDELTALAEKGAEAVRRVRAAGHGEARGPEAQGAHGSQSGTGEAIKIPAKTVVKARIAKQLKDTVLPKK
jgi:DNA-binding protein HU-beta